MALPSPHCRTSGLTIAIPHCTTKDFYHVGFFLLTSQWRGCEIRFQWLWASPRHCQQMYWGCTLITHEYGAYAQTPEVSKGELHPHGSLWLRRRCATSATLSREVFSEPLTSWSFGRMGRKSDVGSDAALWPPALLFTPTCPWRQEQERRLRKPRNRIQLRQACASPWHGAWCSALPASLSLHTAAFLSISTQPLSLIHPSWDKAEGPSLSSPIFATKILCPHSLEVSWAHKHVSWLSVTASVCLPHLCLHIPPLKASSLGHLQPALPVWNVLLTCSLCSTMNSLCK